MERLKFVYVSDRIDVVRCRDCKYSHMTVQDSCKFCDFWQDEIYVDGSFYCAAGERRDEDGM